MSLSVSVSETEIHHSLDCCQNLALEDEDTEAVVEVQDDPDDGLENLEMEKIPELKKKTITVVEEFFENLDQNNIMSMIADGDEVAIRQLFRGIRRSKWDETVSYYIWMIGEYLTRFATFLSEIQIRLVFFSCSAVTWLP